MEIVNNKCKNCGGELIYDAESQELKCMQCDGITDIPEQDAIIEKKQYHKDSSIQLSETEYTQYTCGTCGRRHIAPKNQDVVYCPSCGDSNLEKNITVEYLPDGIIPFKLNKEKALLCFKDWLKKRKFAPNNLKKLAKSQSLTGLYLPIYDYDFDTTTHYSGVGVNEYKDSDGKTHTSRHPFRGNRSDIFEDFVESANTEVPSPDLREMGNYNYRNIYVYRPEFLYGWIGSNINISLHDSCVRARNAVANKIASDIKRSLHYDRVENFVCNTTFNAIKYSYLYIPVWVNHYKYKDKNYNCYINGITGKVSGKAPKSFWKIFFTVIAAVAVVGAIVFLAYKYSA